MKRHRLSLDLDREAKRNLEKMAKAGGWTITETIRRSLGLMHLSLDYRNEGGRIIFEDSKGKQEALKFL